MLNSFFGITSIESLDQGWQDVRLFSEQSFPNDEMTSATDNYNTVEKDIILTPDPDPLGLLSNETFHTTVLANGNSRALRITSSHFSSMLYLTKCHNNASFEEIFIKGRAQLRDSLAIKPTKFKTLVQENFDRFVQALSNVLSVFGDMQGRGLAMPDHYGTKRSTDALSLAHMQAREIYNFQINRIAEENVLKLRLDFLEHFENLFKLESMLKEAFEVKIFDRELVEAIKLAYIQLKSSKISAFFQNKLKEHYWTGRIAPLVIELIKQLKIRIFDAKDAVKNQFQDVKNISELETLIREISFVNETFLDNLIEHLRNTALNEIQEIL